MARNWPDKAPVYLSTLLILVLLVLAVPLTVAAQGKVIQNPAEYNAYVWALQQKDVSAKIAGFEAFLQQFPSSIMKEDALEVLIGAYQQTNQADKVTDTALRLLQTNPNNKRALAITAHATEDQSERQIPALRSNTDYVAKLREATNFSVPDVDTPMISGPVAPHSYGLVIGVEDYQGIPKVSYAAHDAFTVKEYFVKALGVPAEHIRSYGNPTTGQMRAGVRWLIDQARNDHSADARLFLYYAGHGVPDVNNKMAYLLGVDGDPAYLADTAYSLDEITKGFEGVGAQSILLLDACFSGLAARDQSRSGLIKGARPAFVEVRVPGSEHVIVFSAAGGDQMSNALDAAQHGLFTYYLLSGLQGKAADGEGRVTVSSLYEYVEREVSEAGGRLNVRQVPTLNPSEQQLGKKGGMLLERIR